MSRKGNLHSQVHKKVSLKMHNYNPFNILSYPFFFYSFCRYLRKENPDVIITALPSANILVILAKFISFSKARIIISEHGPSQEWLKKRNDSRLLLLMLNYAIYHLYRYADAIVVVSHYLISYVREYSKLPDPGMIHCIYNPVDFQSPAKARGKAAPHPWFKDKKIPVILAVGRLHPAKDFSMLLEAFARVRESMDVRLLILGEGPERELLEKKCQLLKINDYVEMPGFVKNPHSYMRQAKLFVMSSAYEGLPTALIEALVCGCPVVSTNCASGPSEILENGKYGLLVPVGDAAALSKAIIKSLKNYNDGLLKVALFKKKKQSNFSTTQAVNSYKKLISSVLANR